MVYILIFISLTELVIYIYSFWRLFQLFLSIVAKSCFSGQNKSSPVNIQARVDIETTGIAAINPIIDTQDPFSIENSPLIYPNVDSIGSDNCAKKSILYIQDWLDKNRLPNITCLEARDNTQLNYWFEYQDSRILSKSVLIELFSAHRNTRMQRIFDFLHSDTIQSIELGTSISILLKFGLNLDDNPIKANTFDRFVKNMTTILQTSRDLFICDFMLANLTSANNAVEAIKSQLTKETPTINIKHPNNTPYIEELLQKPFMRVNSKPFRIYILDRFCSWFRRKLTFLETIYSIDMCKNYCDTTLENLHSLQELFWFPPHRHPFEFQKPSASLLDIHKGFDDYDQDFQRMFSANTPEQHLISDGTSERALTFQEQVNSLDQPENTHQLQDFSHKDVSYYKLEDVPIDSDLPQRDASGKIYKACFNLAQQQGFQQKKFQKQEPQEQKPQEQETQQQERHQQQRHQQQHHQQQRHQQQHQQQGAQKLGLQQQGLQQQGLQEPQKYNNKLPVVNLKRSCSFPVLTRVSNDLLESDNKKPFKGILTDEENILACIHDYNVNPNKAIFSSTFDFNIITAMCHGNQFIADYAKYVVYGIIPGNNSKDKTLSKQTEQSEPKNLNFAEPEALDYCPSLFVNDAIYNHIVFADDKKNGHNEEEDSWVIVTLKNDERVEYEYHFAGLRDAVFEDVLELRKKMSDIKIVMARLFSEEHINRFEYLHILGLNRKVMPDVYDRLFKVKQSYKLTVQKYKDYEEYIEEYECGFVFHRTAEFIYDGIKDINLYYTMAEEGTRLTVYVIEYVKKKIYESSCMTNNLNVIMDTYFKFSTLFKDRQRRKELRAIVIALFDQVSLADRKYPEFKRRVSTAA